MGCLWAGRYVSVSKWNYNSSALKTKYIQVEICFILPWVSTAGIKLVWKHLDLQQLELSKFGGMGCRVNGWKPRNGQTRNWWFAFLLCMIFFHWFCIFKFLASHESSMTESLILVGRRHVLVQLFFEFTSSPTTCLFSLQFQFIALKIIEVMQRFGLLHVVFGRCSSDSSIHRCKWTEDRVPYLQGVSVPSSSPSLDKRRKDTTEASCQTVVLWKDGPIFELAFSGSQKFHENATKCNQTKPQDDQWHCTQCAKPPLPPDAPSPKSKSSGPGTSAVEALSDFCWTSENSM